MDTYLMVKRKSDEKIVRMYKVPLKLPEDVTFRKVMPKARKQIHQEYPRNEYTLLVGDAQSPEDFLRSFPDWAKGATILEAEEWNCAVE